MTLSQLPYELITYIGSFLHISDFVNLATTCAYFHSCARDRLAIHQKKLSILSTVSDRNRPQTTELLRSTLFEDDSNEDAWYHREVVVHAFDWSAYHDQLHKMTEVILPDGKPLDMQLVVSDLGQSRLDSFSEHLRWSDNCFEGFLTMALLRMPRLSSLRFALHPCHGYARVYASAGFNQSSLTLPHAHTLSLFTMVVKAIGRNGVTSNWPPGLQSLESIVVEIDALHEFNTYDFRRAPSFPYLRFEDFLPFFELPNLRRLQLSRHPSIQSRFNELSARELKLLSRINGSPLEELILIGFSGWQEYINQMVQKIRRLRVLVLHHRGYEDDLEDVIKALQSLHASSLEIIVLPQHTSNALSWCQAFSQLKYLTVSYVEVTVNLRKHQSSAPASGVQTKASTSFPLATMLPQTIEFLVLIGGRQSSTVTTVRPIPLYGEVQEFLDIVVTFVLMRGWNPGSKMLDMHARNLRDICFGDMRIAVRPQDRATGKILHQSYTKAREVARLKLNQEIEKSERLRDTCKQFGVVLHITDLKSRLCNHSLRHPYIPKKRMSRQELMAEAEKLSENADNTTQAVLARYVENIPRKYKP